MFDEIRCYAPLPDDLAKPGRLFQSHSLYCSMDQFTITEQGRLIHHRCRYEFAGEREVRPGLFFPQSRRIPVADIDMDYHGDVRLYDSTDDGTALDYVARFTHGSLEWIKPYAALSDVHRSWFDSKR